MSTRPKWKSISSFCTGPRTRSPNEAHSTSLFLRRAATAPDDSHSHRSERDRREMAGRLTAAGSRILGGGGARAAAAALRQRAGMGLPVGRHIVPDKPVSPSPPNPNPNPTLANALLVPASGHFGSNRRLYLADFLGRSSLRTTSWCGTTARPSRNPASTASPHTSAR